MGFTKGLILNFIADEFFLQTQYMCIWNLGRSLCLYSNQTYIAIYNYQQPATVVVNAFGNSVQLSLQADGSTTHKQPLVRRPWDKNLSGCEKIFYRVYPKFSPTATFRG